MNRQQDFQHSFHGSARTKKAAYFREKAREALKHHWGLAILAFLLATLLGAEGFSPEIELDIELSDLRNIPFESLGSMLGWAKHFLANIPALKTAALLAAAWSMLFSLAVVLFVGAPLTMGYEQLHLDWLEGKHESGISELFCFFKICYGKAVVLRILYTLLQMVCWLPAVLLSFPLFFYVLATWSEAAIGTVLLLSLPLLVGWLGSTLLSLFVKYNYIYCFMILGEGPEMSPIDALRNSRHLMKGNKWRLFCLDFSFIGWYLLSAVTCKLAMLYVAPYHESARASFFLEASSLSIARETEFPSLNPEDYHHSDEDSF